MLEEFDETIEGRLWQEVKWHLERESTEFRVHGNGFIQTDFPSEGGAGTRRIHVWHPSVPRQKVSTMIHDHNYSFFSRILKGKMVNITYRKGHLFNNFGNSIPGCWTEYKGETRDRQDTILSKVQYSIPVNLDIVSADVYTAGDSYFFSAFDFHEIIVVEPVLTVMTKVEVFPTQAATVLVPIEEEPDNTFNRYTALDNETARRICLEVLHRGI